MQMALMGRHFVKPALQTLCPLKGHLANNVDPDQILQNVASGQGLHCLYEIQEFL